MYIQLRAQKSHGRQLGSPPLMRLLVWWETLFSLAWTTPVSGRRNVMVILDGNWRWVRSTFTTHSWSRENGRGVSFELNGRQDSSTSTSFFSTSSWCQLQWLMALWDGLKLVTVIFYSCHFCYHHLISLFTGSFGLEQWRLGQSQSCSSCLALTYNHLVLWAADCLVHLSLSFSLSASWNFSLTDWSVDSLSSSTNLAFSSILTLMDCSRCWMGFVPHRPTSELNCGSPNHFLCHSFSSRWITFILTSSNRSCTYR